MNDTQALPVSDGDRHKTDNGVTEKDADRANYVCPMCPGVESDGPDARPKCGMALEPATPAPQRKVQYTCPMHPDAVRDEPGECPKCGMALEPTTNRWKKGTPSLST